MRNLFVIANLLCAVAIVSGQPTWLEHIVSSDYVAARDVFASDIDGDGDIDVVGSALSEGITWWENTDGEGLVWSEHQIDLQSRNSRSVCSADIDGDGDFDVIAEIHVSDSIIWWENFDGDGSTWVEHLVNDNYDQTNSVMAVDMDNDQDIDLLGAAETNGNGVAWWENIDGSGIIWTEHEVDYTAGDAKYSFAADIDNDFDMDVIVATGSMVGDLFLYKNLDGIGTIWNQQIIDSDEVGGQGYCAYAGDIDGDSDLDIVGGFGGSYMIVWWENTDGSGSNWVEHYVQEQSTNPYELVIIDYENDGDSDIVSWMTSEGYHVITLWNNVNGDGLSWSSQPISGNLTNLWGLYFADMDSDNDFDVLSASMGDSLIAWWEQPGSPYFEVQVVTPNGDESWHVEVAHDIEWISSSLENVDIDLIDDNGLVDVLAEDIANTGLFEWIPSGNLPPDADYRIQITLVTGDEQDVSDAPFMILNPPTVTLTPFEPPIVLQPYGGGFWYWYSVHNTTEQNVSGQAWTEVILPNGSPYGPLSTMNVSVGAGQVYAPPTPLGQWIPGYAPAGTYDFVMHIGLFPNFIVDSDSFEFEKLPGAGVTSLHESSWSVDDWHNETWELADVPMDDDDAIHLPADYIVSPAHPNPFNASTTISVSLPVAAELTVVVYNVAGQQVATITDGHSWLGTYNLTFDASDLASGLYFIRATVPGQVDQVQKVMLVR